MEIGSQGVYNLRVEESIRKPERYEGTSKIPIFKLFSKLVKLLIYSINLYLKNAIFYLFPELEKTEKSKYNKKSTRNHIISLLIRKNVEVQPKINTQKAQFRVSWLIGKSYVLI